MHKIETIETLLYATVDFNLNFLDYSNNDKVTKFVNITFEYGLLPVGNKQAHVTRTSATAKSHITENSLVYLNVEQT